jgi:hypothetical protein
LVDLLALPSGIRAHLARGLGVKKVAADDGYTFEARRRDIERERER